MKVSKIVLLASIIQGLAFQHDAMAGWSSFKKKATSEKAWKDVAKTTSNGVSTNLNSSWKIVTSDYAKIGKIEGLIETPVNFTSSQALEAYNSMQSGFDVLEAFANSLDQAAYEQLCDEYVDKVSDIMDETRRVARDSSSGLNILAKIGQDLTDFRFNDAMNDALKDLNSESGVLRDLVQQAALIGPYNTIYFSADMSLSLEPGTEMVGSFGIAINLDENPKVKGTVFFSAGAAISSVPPPPVDAGLTMGFLEGGPRSIGGDGVDLGMGPLSFSVPLDISFFSKPHLEGFAVSLAATDFNPESEQADPHDKDLSITLSHTQVIQVIGATNSENCPLYREQLGSPTWLSSNGHVLRLVNTGHNGAKKKDYYDVYIDGVKKTAASLYYSSTGDNFISDPFGSVTATTGRLSVDGLILSTPFGCSSSSSSCSVISGTTSWTRNGLD